MSSRPVAQDLLGASCRWRTGAKLDNDAFRGAEVHQCAAGRGQGHGKVVI